MRFPLFFFMLALLCPSAIAAEETGGNSLEVGCWAEWRIIYPSALSVIVGTEAVPDDVKETHIRIAILAVKDKRADLSVRIASDLSSGERKISEVHLKGVGLSSLLVDIPAMIARIDGKKRSDAENSATESMPEITTVKNGDSLLTIYRSKLSDGRKLEFGIRSDIPFGLVFMGIGKFSLSMAASGSGLDRQPAFPIAPMPRPKSPAKAKNTTEDK